VREEIGEVKKLINDFMRSPKYDKTEYDTIIQTLNTMKLDDVELLAMTMNF
jgi:hypothetical protein